MKHTKYIIIIIIAFISTNCKDKKTAKTTHQETKITQHNDAHITVTKKQFESSKMKLGKLVKQDFPNVVKVTGMIDVPPQSKEIISSFFGGFVKKSNLLIGDKVKKGQALVTIENPKFVDLQQNYLEVKAQLTFLKSEYERQETLYNEQITSKKNFLKAESDYKRQKAKYNGLRKKLQLLRINPTSVEQGNITSSITLYASISGHVTKINVSKGTHVSPSDAVMEIVNTDHIHIELTVFEKDVMKIKKGQNIRFKIPEASDSIYDAEVHLVGTSIDENSRTIKVHGHLHDDEKYQFATGMFVDADIETTNKKAFGLPEDAIVENGEHMVVLVIENNENETYIFKSIDVELGKSYNGFVEVISENLNADDKILVKGAYSLVGVEAGGHDH
jgi:cobalt-zinc-cadmium efflux system membrane fusion protein